MIPAAVIKIVGLLPKIAKVGVKAITLIGKGTKFVGGLVGKITAKPALARVTTDLLNVGVSHGVTKATSQALKNIPFVPRSIADHVGDIAGMATFVKLH